MSSIFLICYFRPPWMSCASCSWLLLLVSGIALYVNPFPTPGGDLPALRVPCWLLRPDGARRVGPVHARKRPQNGSRAAKAGCGRLTCTGMDALLPSRSDGPLDVRPEWWCSRRAGVQISARRHAGHQKCSVSLSARARSVRIHVYTVSANPWVKDSYRVRACGSWLNLRKKLA